MSLRTITGDALVLIDNVTVCCKDEELGRARRRDRSLRTLAKVPPALEALRVFLRDTCSEWRGRDDVISSVVRMAADVDHMLSRPVPPSSMFDRCNAMAACVRAIRKYSTSTELPFSGSYVAQFGNNTTPDISLPEFVKKMNARIDGVESGDVVPSVLSESDRCAAILINVARRHMCVSHICYIKPDELLEIANTRLMEDLKMRDLEPTLPPFVTDDLYELYVTAKIALAKVLDVTDNENAAHDLCKTLLETYVTSNFENPRLKDIPPRVDRPINPCVSYKDLSPALRQWLFTCYTMFVMTRMRDDGLFDCDRQEFIRRLRTEFVTKIEQALLW